MIIFYTVLGSIFIKLFHKIFELISLVLMKKIDVLKQKYESDI